MKIIILVADEEGVGVDNHPQCFTETINNISLIEYQVRMLRLLNIKPSKITIVTGSNGSWKDHKYHSLVSKLNTSEMVIENRGCRSYASLREVVKQLPDLGDMLILNGNRYFDLNEIELLLENKETSTLVEKRNNLDGEQLHVKIKRGFIQHILENKRIDKLPWYSFYGAIFLTKTDIEKIQLSNIKGDDLSYIEAIVNELKIQVKVHDVSSYNSNEEWGWKSSADLRGGSFAGLGKSVLVKKAAERDGSNKLINEIKWLTSIPQEIKHVFPTVIDSNVDGNNTWYTMPWYSKESLRKKILTGKVSESYVLKQLEVILDFMWKEIYSRKSIECPANWVEEKYYNRFSSRLNYLRKIEPFKDIMLLKTVCINGKEFENLPTLFKKIKTTIVDNNIFLKPDSLCMIHGDLHFQNMLVNEELDDFILADPRGELDGGDIYYDLGKLWHSVNGKYDLIHTDIASTQFSMDENKNVYFHVDMGPEYLIKIYDEIKKGLENILAKYPIAQDANYLTKIKISEFIHFSSLMYFHLKNDLAEARALTIYSQAILLGTNLLREIRGLK